MTKLPASGTGTRERIESIMNEAQETSCEQAVANYIQNNPKRIDCRVTGQM